MVNPLQIEPYSWENHLQISHFRLPHLIPTGWYPAVFWVGLESLWTTGGTTLHMNNGNIPWNPHWSHALNPAASPPIKRAPPGMSRHPDSHAETSTSKAPALQLAEISAVDGTWLMGSLGHVHQRRWELWGLNMFKHHKIGKMENFSVQWDGSQ